VVSSVPARHYDATALDRGLQRLDWVGARALAHEAVVEHFLTASAVLPMRLFSLFTSDERAIQHVAHDRRRITRILARIGGRVEWGLRVTLSAPQGSVPGSDPRSGAAYLAHKRNLREAAHTRLARARRDAERVYRAIRRTAVAAKRRTEVEQATPGSPIVLDAAFLMPAGRGRAFQAAVRRHVRPLQRAGMTVSLTGPWPAYNFI
jgi:triphosphoribosyl-dephospho-CoA synthetase